MGEDTKEANSEASDWAALRAARALPRGTGKAQRSNEAAGRAENLWAAALNEYWRLKAAGLNAEHCCWQFRYLVTVPELQSAAELFLESHGCAIKSRVRGSTYATQ